VGSFDSNYFQRGKFRVGNAHPNYFQVLAHPAHPVPAPMGHGRTRPTVTHVTKPDLITTSKDNNNYLCGWGSYAYGNSSCNIIALSSSTPRLGPYHHLCYQGV